MSFQRNKYTTEKALESHIHEIVESRRWCIIANPNKVFPSTKTHSFICAKFQWISWQFSNFKKFRHIKETYKIFRITGELYEVLSSESSLAHNYFPQAVIRWCVKWFKWLKKFQKLRNIHESTKMLDPQINSRKLSPMNNQWPTLSLLMKRSSDSMICAMFQIISM